MTLATDYDEKPKEKKSILTWTPWLEIVALSTIVICIISSAVIVSVSHDKEVSTWRISPAVWLAIFSAISNVAFSSALATGIAVRFWLHASNGTQLSQLHYIWDHGRGLGFWSAIKSGSEARKVTLICTVAYLVQFSSGPLFQRSTHTLAQNRVLPVNMFFDIANRIPDGWNGNWKQDKTVINLRRVMSQTQGWYRNDSIAVPAAEGYACDGTCSGFVRGAGFVYTCAPTTYEPLDLSTNASHRATVFHVRGELEADEQSQPVLTLLTKHISNVQGNCQATVKIDRCNITAAVVEHPVIIQNSTAWFDHSALRFNQSLNMISPYASSGDYLTAPINSGVGPLAGLQAFISGHLYDNATTVFNTNLTKWLYAGPGPGTLADVFFRSEPSDAGNTSLSSCLMVWEDPTEYILANLHEWMFRVAERVGRGTERQSFVASRSIQVLVFWSENQYLGPALAVALLGLTFVASLSWGWWRLEKPVTLSPLETGKVFGGEIFRGVRGDATVNEILREVKDVEVRVGTEGGRSGEEDQITRVEVGMERVKKVYTTGSGSGVSGVFLAEGMEKGEGSQSGSVAGSTRVQSHHGQV
ncbi:hypothetical protein QBC40DRAFT_287648 [Triangularia verruculosa]|uniref:Uncharacterized protein n=1 Tax=Triangularia verruculosa TaxID=2587418 RepID=A0AAN6X9P9_9PEZI|nr:hypothetical protein QBC40DRAFT_287648 [Triangularia verruculosa]